MLRTRSAPLAGKEHGKAEPTIALGGDVLKIQTRESTDRVTFRLFSEDSPGLEVACGKLELGRGERASGSDKKHASLLTAYQQFKDLRLEFTGAAGVVGSVGKLQLHGMYRANELTKNPRGRLELELESSRSATLKMAGAAERVDYSPIMEFILGDQRILVDEPLQLRKTKMNQLSRYRRWNKQKHLSFETQSAHDVLVVKFYARKEPERGEELTGGEKREVEGARRGEPEHILKGAELLDLSALLLQRPKRGSQADRPPQEQANQDDEEENETAGRARTEESQYLNAITIDLRRVCPAMRGEIRIKCAYKPKQLSKTAGLGRADVLWRARENLYASGKRRGEQGKDASSTAGSSAAKAAIRADAASLMHGVASTESLRATLSMITLDFLQLRGIDARRARPSLRHIMLELSYGR